VSNKLAGKVAHVTGASRGIGAGIARRLAADGAATAITYPQSPAKADEVVESIIQAGGKAVAIDAAAVRRSVSETEKPWAASTSS